MHIIPSGQGLGATIDFDPQLPRLDNGKLYKTALRDRYWEGRTSRVN